MKTDKFSLLISAWIKSPERRLIAIGSALFAGVTVWIFAPYGLLHSLSQPDESTTEAAIETPVEQLTEPEMPADMSLEKNAAFLAENAKKSGVDVTDSGLHYREIAAGTGKQPSPTSEVTVHYQGTFINGREFDSSYKRGKPISFPLNGVIAGWTEGLQLMREGGKAELVIPQDLAYGEGRPGIPPFQTLVFQVELIKVD